MASASAMPASSNAVSTPVLTAASFLSMMKDATPEEKATIVALLGSPSKKGKTTEKVVAPSAPVDIGNRPAFPARLSLVEADKRCHARRCIVSTEDWFNKDSGLPSGGFKSKILLESQCPKDAKSHHLCTTCSEKKEKGWVKGKGDWHGLVGGSVPKESHVVGGEWAEKQYDTMWGVVSPSRTPSPPAARSKEAPKAPAKEKKEKKVKKEKEEPKEVAVAAPPPPKVEKSAGSLYFSEELDAFIRLTDRHIFATKVDDATFACIPDLEECLGILKEGVKPEDAVPTDMEAIVEEEAEASESEEEDE